MENFDSNNVSSSSIVGDNNQQESLFRLPKANKIQQKYIESIIKNSKRNKFKTFYDPNENLYDLSKYRGSKTKTNLSDLSEDFMKKPIIICAPDELLEPGCKLKCDNCKNDLTVDGWADNHGRYVHGLKTGYYLVQKKYFCKNCKTKINAFQTLTSSSVSEAMASW